MFSSAEKSTHVSRQQQTAGATFFKKAGENDFLGNQKRPSFFSAPVQAKLTVSSPDDPQEKEADAAADKVMRMAEPAAPAAPKEEEKLDRKEEKEEEKVQTKPDAPVIAVQRKEDEEVQAKCDYCMHGNDTSHSGSSSADGGEEKEQKVSRKNIGLHHSDVIQCSGRGPPAGSTDFEQSLSSTKGQGSPMPAATQQFMENGFNADFSGVRIHTGSHAESLSRSINAQAFTHGNDIYFNSNKYSPNTHDGGTLLAHELTHTIQQGGTSTVQRKTPPQPAQTVPPPAEIISLTKGVFTPSDSIAKYIEEGGSSGKSVNVSFGSYASGTLKVKKHKDVFKTIGNIQGIPMQLPFLQPLVNVGIQPLLAVEINDSKINGYVTIAVGKTQQQVGSPAGLFDWLKKNPTLMRWSGLENLAAKKDNIVNEIAGDKIHFEVKDISVKLGGFVDGKFSIGLFNSTVVVEGSAAVTVKSLANGTLNFKRDELGDLRGNFEMQAQVKNFTGAVKGAFLNGIFDIHGKLGYHTEKLSGEVDIIVTDPKQAKTLVLQQMEPQQISKEAEERAGVNDPVSGPQPGPRAIAGWGTLNFAFNKWLTGMAKVIVDDEGHITVHGEITPPAEVPLFPAKPYRSPNFIDLHPTFRWGIPYLADLHVGLDFLLYAEAQIGPAVLRNIKIIGNYSTDPLLYNDFRIQATFNLIGYAGLVFTFGAHAGVGILGFDVDLKGTLSATAGIKGYVEATPVIGYREKADPVAGKKGEFFISGEAEVAAQPFLKLAGAIGVYVDSPWPIPNFSRSWPLFEKEYPLPGQFGVGLTFGEYILGSGEWPKVDFNKVNFDPEKFKDDLIEKNIPPKQNRNEEKKGGFADKMQGQEPAPPPPAPAVAHKKSSAKPEKAATKEVLERWGNGMKALRALKDKRDDKPVSKDLLLSDLGSMRRKFKFTVLTADPVGQNWSVYAEMPGIDNSTAPVGIKGIAEEKKEDKQGEKPGEANISEKESMEQVHAKIHIAKPFSMNGESHTLYLNYVNGKPVFEMASGRRALLRQLVVNAQQEIKNQHGNPWDEMKSKLQDLLGKELDPLTEKLVNENHSEEFKTQNDYEKALGNITGLLTYIGNNFHVKSLDFVLPVTSQIHYGPRVNGFGSSMQVDILTKDGPGGSAVTNALRNTGHMSALDKRKNGDGKYYVLGHLLNSKLHGPGNKIENLAPITGSANGLHETQVENDIKTGIENNRIFKYTVATNGSQGYNSSLYKYFASKGDLIRASIVHAEQYVPLQFICNVEELQADGKPLHGGLKKTNYPVDIIISQLPSSYEV